jgi:predicted MFS family arabinose efflux permease
MSICRAAAGVAWALAFMVVQGDILSRTASKLRLQTLGVFVTVIMISLVCAPQLGGMLADAYGEQAALALSALLCVLAFGLVWRSQVSGPSAAAPTAAAPSSAASSGRSLPGDLLRNAGFLSLVVFSAMPAKLLLVGYCFYFAPMAAAAAGYSASMAGRLMMLYALLMIMCMPLVAGISERLRVRLHDSSYHALVAVGMLLSGLAGLLLVQLGGVAGAGAAMALLGLAQALSTTPQATAIQLVAHREIATHGNNAVFAYYRLLERTGSALGPLAFGALIAALGAEAAIHGIALASLACAAALTVALAWRYRLTLRSRTP